MNSYFSYSTNVKKKGRKLLFFQVSIDWLEPFCCHLEQNSIVYENMHNSELAVMKVCYYLC